MENVVNVNRIEPAYLCDHCSGLQVTCNEATLRVRPDLPASGQWPTLGAKATKTHIARHFSNTVKMHGLERQLSNEKFITFH